MMVTKKQKIITLSLVIVAILTLTIGFSAFSSNLFIKSLLKVNPENLGDVNVLFSLNSSSVQTGSLNAYRSSGVETALASLDNSGGPKVTGISATFTQPGDYVEYRFYSINKSEKRTAYLTNILFENVSGKSVFKYCSPDAGTTATNDAVQRACESIKVTVTVSGNGGNAEATTTGTVSSHPLAKDASEVVTLRIEYLDGYEADGPFTVDFGNILLVYNYLGETPSTIEYPSTNDTPYIQIYKPQYYSWSSGSIGSGLPGDASKNVSDIDTQGEKIYLGLDEENGIVTAAYACFTRNETEYCLKGGEDTAYETNKTVLEESFMDVQNGCHSLENGFDCWTDSLNANVQLSGDVVVDVNDAACSITSDGSTFGCTTY